jgi:hypothetical protein
MMSNEEQIVELVLLLEGGGRLTWGIHAKEQHTVAARIVAMMKASKDKREPVGVFDYVLWNNAIQGFYFREQPGPDHGEQMVELQRRWVELAERNSSDGEEWRDGYSEDDDAE